MYCSSQCVHFLLHFQMTHQQARCYNVQMARQYDIMHTQYSQNNSFTFIKITFAAIRLQPICLLQMKFEMGSTLHYI
jgi:hypothetical protein